ncbi:MAG: ATP-binding protein [Cyclobacteriaceae bacterium]
MSSVLYNILYIDDEQNNLVVFKNAFFRHYNIFTALSGLEGLKILEKENIHLVITDQKMPGMTGVEFLEKIVESHPDAIRMILTAYSDIDFIMRAVNKCGIYRYILKPWDTRELKIVIDKALENYQLSQDKKNLIRNLEEMNKGLEQKVLDRTQELDHKNQELVKINAIKDKLFTIISHDLRQPLLSLGVFLEVLRKLPDNLSQEKWSQFHSKVSASLHDVTNLLDNLLYWSQAQMGSREVELRQFKVKNIIDKNIELYRDSANQKQIQLKAESLQEDPIVVCDENVLNLVMRNLLNNAIKYTDHNGKVTVALKLENGHLKISIMDTGIGMAPELIEKLFEKQYHYTSPGTENERGTGLGLKLCKEFIERQDGTISVESQPGEGSNFSFTIPLA